MRITLKRSLGIVVRVSGFAISRWKIALAALLAFVPACATANAEILVSRYAVNLDGLRVGDAILHTDLDAKRYKVQVSANVSMLLISTQIQGQASGARSGAKLTPEHFQMVTSGSGDDAMEVDFSNLSEETADGPMRLRGAFDPLSALLIASYRPQSRSGHPCNTVLPIFTGRDRFVLELQPMPAGSGQIEPALMLCQVTLSQPLPGGTRIRQFKWKIAFTQSAKPNFWLVERASLPTQNGTLTIDRTETSMSAR
jgi:hypothetical protein